MQVRQKRGLDVDAAEAERLDASLEGGARLSNDAGAEVDQVGRAVDHDDRGGAGSIGIGAGRPGSEHDELRRSALVHCAACPVFACRAFG